jgi:hypothetical protein
MTLEKYRRRSAGEEARRLLKEVFSFLEEGVPGDRIESRAGEAERVSEFQTAIRDILKSTRLGTMPEEHSIEVFERHLNLPVKVAAQVARTSYSYKYGKTRGKDEQDMLVFFFDEESYLQHVAKILRRCLEEFYPVLFVTCFPFDVWLIGVCPVCDELFFKSKPNQVCCSRACGNRHDYDNRTSTDEGKKRHRDKSSKSYDAVGREKAARKRRESLKAEYAALQHAIKGIADEFGGLPKEPGSYDLENRILRELTTRGYRTKWTLDGNQRQLAPTDVRKIILSASSEKA